ncbi:MAG: TonB-dependent siderophore receptor [Gammaproteobacteria bacterium]|nr:TonB-dependent siderophore receptor [Gammaproteobacteria bacterium]MBU1490633.1 TonB-dependent siderophore receptor [Gammaproteobacteria bacterium]MBU2067938.1 TonB-dependent siderophore receptor [Gammaproteobacteria bacterium]MBU2139999.1 TonB-dependent siderophore receptor [Gammaproteobacteria bacterium]MBU2217407.1 TonB-dependent siderophore receptor [Gammaproteobacteria bacterium]
MLNRKTHLAVAIAAACSFNNAVAAEQEQLELDAQTVVSSSAAGADSYQSQPSSAAIKLDLTPRQTPQAMSTLTGAQLRDFKLTSVNDALKAAPGIQVQEVETDRTYYTSRGFDITNFQYDGISVPFVYGNVEGDLDTAMYERVEVVRGANGLMTGTGNPSATINFVRKRPTATPEARVDLTAGSWDKRRIDTDVSGPLNDAGTVRGRAVYANENKNSYLDRYSREKNLFHGVLEFDLDERTLFTLGHTLQTSDANGSMWGALPLVYQDGGETDYSRSTSTAADWAYWDNQENRSFAEVARLFDNDWQAKAVLTRVEKKSDGSMFYVYGTPNRETGAGLYSYPSEYTEKNTQLIVDLQASGPFSLAGREHQATLGASWSRSELEDLSWYDSTTGTMLPPLEDWNGHIGAPLNDNGSNGSDFTDRMKSVYGAARWSLSDDLSLITGARVVDVKSDGTNYGLAKSTKTSGKVVPYAGVVYDLTEQYSLYASYTEIFDAQTKTDRGGSRLAPVEGVNYEAGIKGELFDDKVDVSLAVFRTEQDNFAEQAGVNGAVAYYRAVEGLTSEGYELEFAGEPLDGLQLSAGYTFVDITKADGSHGVTYAPKHMIKTAATYRVPGMEKLKVGGAVRWQDDIKIAVPLTADDGFTSIGTADAKQKAYAVVDLMASYEIDANWSVSANLNNLTDEKYLSSLYWTQAYYGAPRNASMSVSWKY